MRTIAEIIADANSRGLWLSNLFQLTDGLGWTGEPSRLTGVWQANFHHAIGYCDFGHGSTPEEALENAFKALAHSRMPNLPPAKPRIECHAGEDGPCCKTVDPFS